MLLKNRISAQSALRTAITHAYRLDEETCLKSLIQAAYLSPSEQKNIKKNATDLAALVREGAAKQGGLDTLLEKYDLSSEEGIALMCVAEALLRIPDSETVDKLLEDKLTSANWAAHLGESDSLFANAMTWSLMLTGKLYTQPDIKEKGLMSALKKLTRKSSGLAIRPAVKNFMKFLGRKFVMGESIEDALKRASVIEAQGYRYSYDMLGEAARTQADADRYFDAYVKAINAIGAVANGRGPIESPGISIKLSALHPRYEFAKRERMLNELVPKLRELALLSKKFDINLTVDAEEADRLDISLDVIEAVFSDPALNGWEGFGLAVQSYQKRAPFVLDWLADLSRQHKRRLMVRLIKGAYWDSEIKRSQELGLEGYPVFTRKHATDVSFIACAKKMIANIDAFYPQFATHNAHSIAVILEFIGDHPFEFQCLHGMGQKLYDHIVGEKNKNIPCRIYAPVGYHEDLLGYLMRRLLENGANTSFVNLIAHRDLPVDELLVNPVDRIARLQCKPHPNIPLPVDIFGKKRKNSRGLDLTNWATLATLQKNLFDACEKEWMAGPIINGQLNEGRARSVMSPADHAITVGTVIEADEAQVEKALKSASAAFVDWRKTPLSQRVACLNRAADLLEERLPTFMALATREAGKSLRDGISEVREAADFCRYYAKRAKIDLKTKTLPGPTGESNQFFVQGRGVIACISPWNFPLAIFMGQVVAALVTGNTVIAKPAEQTPLIAAEAVRLLHEAGMPTDVLHLLPGRGDVVGAKLTADQRVAGVMFTGSTETAALINQTLANRGGPIVPFIAETGGQNAMIVDSSALPEQVIIDVVSSAFDSAGQRCSALRVLFVQEDVADKIITMLKGAMAELQVGDPAWLETDVGPVIDQDALAMLHAHFDRMKTVADLIYQVPLSAKLANKGYFFGPAAFEIKNLDVLKREVFGPFLHVVRYKTKELDQVIESINATGYGLTLGVHSRIQQVANRIFADVNVGNVYVNRNMIGAVVGVQPFGGMGLSGTGPKAGGPHYLLRLCTERALSINITAAGGNASLLTLEEGNL